MEAIKTPPASGSSVSGKTSLLIICGSYVPKENQKKLWALAEHFELVCITANEVLSMGSPVTLSESAGERPFKIIGLETLGNPSSTTKFIFRGLRKAIRENSADIILVESEPWALVRWQTWIWTRLINPKALFAEFTWENLARSGVKGLLLRWIYRGAAATGDFVIGGNQAAGRLFERSGLHPSRLLISPQLGVDETLFVPLPPDQLARLRKEMGFDEAAFLVGFCGRYVEQKGVLDLVASVELVRKKMPDRPVLLVLMGQGPLHSSLAAMAKDRPWLTLLPPRQHSEIAAFMQMLDLFVLPSKPWLQDGETWQEQLGHVLLEAMACGTPCIGSVCGEIPNVVGEADALFPPGDALALAGTIERWIPDSEGRVKLGQRQRDRTLAAYTNTALAKKLSAGLIGRLLAERRSVLWVDPHVTWRSPSMRHPMYALGALKAAGWEVRTWSFESDLSEDDAEVKLWRSPKLPSQLVLIWFFLRANLARWVYRIVKGRKPAAIVHSTGSSYLGADLVSVHFVNALWTRMQWKLGFQTLKQFAAWILSLIGVLMDFLQFRNPKSRRFLCVSESIADAVLERIHPGGSVVVLPNGYDETRFNPDDRALWRMPAREKFGLSTADSVMAFVSTGHYERKGFWLAVDGMAIARLQNPDSRLKLLVIGGSGSALSELQSTLQHRHSDFREWIIFAGQQPRVEECLAAADSLLNPSYFEAFCLAEIEAAAMGIPLLITRHFGSEMILKEGFNGLALEPDPKEIAATIGKFITPGASGFHRWTGSALTRSEYTQALIGIYNSSMRHPPERPV